MNRTAFQKLPMSTLLFSFALLFNVHARKMTDYTGMVFPPDHALNMSVDSLPVHANSDAFITSIGSTTALHPDFGTTWNDGTTDWPMGIPYNIVGASQPKVPIEFTAYNDESDPGPWPIPKDPFIETVLDWRKTDDGDRHMLIIDTSSHTLYETGGVTGNTTGTSWKGGCGAIFKLDGYDLRTETWTSADAAGLPIFPLLIRYDEVERALATGGEFHHAIRFTVQKSQRAYVWPARHYASSSTDKNLAPMGLRFRLRASFDISGYTPRMQVILRTMKKYGLIVADNGSNWFFQGTNDERWDDEELNSLKKLRGSNFEAVDISPWTKRAGYNVNSAKVPGTNNAVTSRPITSCFGQFSLRITAGTRSSVLLSLQLSNAAHVTITAYTLSGALLAEVFSGYCRDGVQTISACLPIQNIIGSTTVLFVVKSEGKMLFSGKGVVAE